MPITNHFLFFIDSRLNVLVFNWLYEGVVLVFLGGFIIVPERTLVFSTPEIVSARFVMPSVKCSRQTSLSTLEIRYPISDLLVTGHFCCNIKTLSYRVSWSVLIDLYTELSLRCLRREDMKGT